MMSRAALLLLFAALFILPTNVVDAGRLEKYSIPPGVFGERPARKPHNTNSNIRIQRPPHFDQRPKRRKSPEQPIYIKFRKHVTGMSDKKRNALFKSIQAKLTTKFKEKDNRGTAYYAKLLKILREQNRTNTVKAGH